MSTDPPNEPWGPPPGGAYPPPPPDFPPPPNYPPPGGSGPYAGGPGGGYPGGGYPGGNVFRDAARTPFGVLAGWWYRVGATVLDGILLFVIDFIFDEITGRLGGTVISFLVQAGYNTYLIGSRGQTLGMMALHTRVADANNGGPISYQRALGRWAVEAVLGVLLFVPLIIDILWPLWDSRNQTLHDKAVNTLVVRTDIPPL